MKESEGFVTLIQKKPNNSVATKLNSGVTAQTACMTKCILAFMASHMHPPMFVFWMYFEFSCFVYFDIKCASF